MEALLNPKLFEAIRDYIGVITLAMLLIFGLTVILLKDAPPKIRVAVLLVIVAIYAAVIFTAMNQNGDSGKADLVSNGQKISPGTNDPKNPIITPAEKKFNAVADNLLTELKKEQSK